MESNARFLNMKSSRFKEDYKGGDTLTQTPSAFASHSRSPSGEGITLQFITKPNQATRMEKIRRFMLRQRGAHHPVNYRSSYGFSQKWETSNKQTTSHQAGFMHLTGQLRWASFVLFPFLAVQFWFISIFRVFQYDKGGWMLAVGLALQLLCILHKLAVIVGEIDFRGDFLHQIGPLVNRQRVLQMGGNIYAVCYYSVALSTVQGRSEHYYLFLLDLVLIAYKYVILEEIYSMIRIQVVGSRYKIFMNLFDLASNVFLMIHVFAILLYLCTYASPENNWHTTSQIQSPHNWIGDYVEAFYFACTTMLTVGYGDIRPTNLLEVVCILVVQLVGIMNNAYVINQIGANLSLIHERRNTLEKDIANAQKMVKFNRMTNQARNRMLDYLLKNQQANEELSVNQEEILLDKLSEQFKEEIKQSSNLRVIHKNLFMLTNFSKRFQRQISKKLVKVIYPPHSVLPNHPGRERLYIISKGSVDIITEKRCNNRAFAEKVIKSIEVNEDIMSHLYINAIYGYANLFSGRPSRIKAVAKNFAVCFFLQHQDILECMVKSSQDFERYYQIKHKVELLQIPEKYELPNITSNRQHYCPNVYYLIKKYKKNKHANNRRYILRSDRRLSKVLQKFDEEIIVNSTSINESSDSFPSAIIEETTIKGTTIMVSLSPQTLMNPLNAPLVSKPRNQQRRESANRQYLQMRKLKLQEKTNAQQKLDFFCENYKQYKNYYPKGNVSQIIQKCNNRNKLDNQHHNDTMRSSRLTMLKNKRKRLASNLSSE